METAAQKTLRAMTNINWFIFGVLFLSVGLFVIYGAAGWAWIGFGAAFLLGMCTAGVVGAKAIVERESN